MDKKGYVLYPEEELMETMDKVDVGSEGEEEEHHQRLMSLLHELVRKNGGRKGAARVLGIDRRTVGACMDGGGLTWRLREALERKLQESAGRAAARQRNRNNALERRVEKVGKELHEGLDAVKDEVGKLREDQDRRWESLEQQLARREDRQESPGPADDPSGAERQREEAPAAAKPLAKAKFPKRLYPELVTKEPADDDEEVYGEAWPLIEEWRDIWNAGHVGTGKGLAWLEVEERVRELEVAMLEEHGLTLPPEKQPLHGLWRSTQLNWRRETLNEVRRAVAWRRLVRKVLTFGLWRSRWWWRA